MIKTLFIGIILFLYSQFSLAKLDRSTTQPLIIPQGAVEASNPTLGVKDVEKIIPTDLQATSDMSHVAMRIADRSLQTWFNSPAIKNSAIGRTANSVQEKISADITLKSTEPQAVEHKFTMQFLALQAMAKFQYTGWLKAVFNYDAKAAESMVEFSDKIFNKDLFVNHTNSTREKISTVGIKWGW